ncbi:chromosome segregation protein SMC [Pectinatus haikarae]|uniref:Chromosome partition protein Smc n=1 Tax=Pectinatus haikarae TaxID=349096 RepID=A0ABT9YAZ0_9FIRM|nr:chromosome segregation protein SMC [Pectinatus haikarae]MDQ0204894.1 chromosome segregation protein [Pectinatus haikarae]
MLLKRLEAYGFKSFADRIEIEFDKGITAVVGPNGSGKSNITDAVRWVLGEQNIRSLRGSKAEDIIFAGSSSRKPSGVAQVSLTFDNEDGRLALDFQEITISRRLFRTGESEFYINKSRCRLKDIYNLFADTGLGKDSISVISQNKVDEVLNAKPEDRRLLFEECAGITKYRDRKKESVKKLENTQQNVLRINDIITEIEKQLEPLSLEAERTVRYNELKSKNDTYQLSYILCSYEKFSSDEKNSTEQFELLQQKQSNMQAAMDVLEAESSSLEENIASLEKNMNDAEFHNRKLTEEINRNRSKCTVLEERIKQNSHSLSGLKASMENMHTQKREAEEKLAVLKNALEITAKNKVLTQKALFSTNASVKSIEEKIYSKENSLRKYRLQLEENRRRFEEQEHRLTLLRHDLTEKEKVLKEKKHNTLKLNDDQKLISEKLEYVYKELSVLKSCSKDIEAKTVSLQKEKETAQGKLRSAEEHSKDLSQNINRIEERIKILGNMQKAYEGFGNGAKKILTAVDHLWHEGICGPVAELISVDQPYITAIQIALGSNIQNIVTDDTDTAKKAIEFLKRLKLGRVTFLPVSVIKPHKNIRENLFDCPGFIDYADKLVKTDKKYGGIIENLLGRTIIVDNIDHALALAKRKNYSSRIVTIEGEIIHAGGAMSGGSFRKELSFLNRSEEIKQLIAKNEVTVSELLLAKTNLTQLMAQLSLIENKIEKNHKQTQQYKLTCAEKDATAAHLRTDIDKLKLTLKETAAAADRLENEINSLKLLCETESAHNIGEKNNTNDTAYFEKLEQEIAEYKTKQKKLQMLLLEQTSSFASLEQTLKGSREKIDLIEQESKRCDISLKNNLAEQTDHQTTIDESVRELQELQFSSKNLQQLHFSGRQEYDKIYKMLMDTRVKNKELADKRKKNAGEMASVQEIIHQADLKLTKISFELSQCEKKLQEEYQLSPQAALTHKADIPEDVLLKEIKRLQNELADMGAVNPNAVKEYDALYERCKFMKTQLEDLLAAKINLQRIIDQMDLTMTKQFKEAFTLIGEYFDDIFEKLFGGGKARLLLTAPDDVLSSGVEIVVQSPGKKTQNLALLSGGERTLTVIALLFSFLQYSPAPFSVLDEIDAPLDEANIRRFGAFLRDYAAKTQFIIVTHRRGTMEAADVMYGVTIEDAGISKIISVKMEEGENE